MTKIGPCSRQNLVLPILVFVGLITSSFSLAKFKERPVDTLVLVGDDARLNCTFDRMPELKGWAKGRLSNSISIEYRVGSRYEDDYELDASSDGSEYDLIIKNATLETTSTYFCADVFDADFNSVARVYAIAEGPSCTADPGFDVVAEENDTFICNMSLPERAPGDLVWFVDGVEMSRQQGMINEWTTSFDKTQNGTTVNCRLEHYTLPREKWSLVNCGDDIVVNVQYAPVVRIVEGDESRVIEGSTYTAQCEIVEYGNPISIEQVYWTGPTGEVYQQGDPLLSIDNVDRRDKGDYTCVMANKFKDGRDGVGMATIHVDVQYTPRVSIQDSSNATVVVGSRYEAVCLPDANPTADVTWEFTSQDVDVELDKLVIQRVDKQHASEYTCRANNILYTGQVGQDTESVELDVQYVPELSLAITGNAATYGAVVEGNSISVDCTVDSANPEIDFLTTSFDGERRTDSQSDSHEFARIDREESGNFTCVAENTFWDGSKGRSSVDIYIDVQYWDGVTVQDVSGRRVIEGQTYSANCTVAANPQPEIFWIFADGTTSENHHLVVENASRTNEQSREFTCMANNRFWDGTPNSGYELVQVDVQYRPRVTVALTQGHAQLEDNAVTVVVGETVSLRCEIIETNPAVDSVLWIDLSELTDVYTFTAEGLQNEGQYTCQASNTFWDGTVGSDQVVISVEVQYPPKLEITDDTGFVEVEGRPYSVRCSAVGNPTPNVHWEGIEEQTPSSQTLSFDSVTREMSREYRCLLRIRTGTTRWVQTALHSSWMCSIRPKFRCQKRSPALKAKMSTFRVTSSLPTRRMSTSSGPWRTIIPTTTVDF
ncbi:B-cell receptor CD22-like [Ptychodera flava]|uniref:B-cell receptor CD22-like n=1 Tax=Ptychodera flava TaxID=63121 RepID=UPI00396A77C3